MRSLRLLLWIVAITIASTATVALSVSPPADAQMPKPPCRLGNNGAGCNFSVFSDSGDGPSTQVTCDPNDNLKCWVNQCNNTYIPDDSQRWGVGWNSDPTRAPVPTLFLTFTDDETVANNWATTTLGDTGSVRNYSETGTWWMCTEVNAEFIQANPGAFLPSTERRDVTFGPGGGIIPVTAIRGSAYAQAEPGIPPIDKAPPVGTGATAKLPAWFWVDDGYWQTNVGRAQSSLGRMVVTVTATPEETTWDTGEGTTVVCTDAGTQWISGMDPYTDSNCAHTFVDSSSIMSNGFHRIEAISRFTMTWTMTFDNGQIHDGGALPDYTATNGWDVVVDEILSVAVSPSDMAQLIQQGQQGSGG